MSTGKFGERKSFWPPEMLSVVGGSKPYYWNPIYDELSPSQLCHALAVRSENVKNSLFLNHRYPPSNSDSITRIEEAFIGAFHLMLNHVGGVPDSITRSFKEGNGDYSVFEDISRDVEYAYDMAKTVLEDVLQIHLDVDTSNLPPENTYGTYEGVCGLLAPMMKTEDYFGVLICMDKLMEKLYKLKTFVDAYDYDPTEDEAVLGLKAGLLDYVSDLLLWVQKTTRGVFALCFGVMQDPEGITGLMAKRSESDDSSMDADDGEASEEEGETDSVVRNINFLDAQENEPVAIRTVSDDRTCGAFYM
ncbi:hypothetical protein SEMRO_3168_G344700.1 [Seminavis robusta]|uniref:Uncharacterized protein n=1 Tax=Seminavis robusta TaxID=568900 RepID=A0A9N8EZL1_9STRA|nr:hypothetical protein SEMRO_3168_G344700.1 [Seminavis robusta]|eukprot:Sro3168_g344700.1 n/a (304) ;mRNA; r:3051-3962